MSDPNRPPTLAEQNAAIDEAIRQAKETQKQILEKFKELTERKEEQK